MHNNITAAGLRDRPPMLATERYAQWQSRFMRYVDTKPNGEALRKCILQGTDIKKKTKIKTKPNKTEHENGMSERLQVQRCPQI
ncbi:hypothetical protein Tco_0279639 [Tanacetum coccineum]